MEYTIIKQLSSTRNQVWLIAFDDGDLGILKQFKNPLGAVIEKSVLNRISITGYAPHVIESGEGYLINEYVEGKVLYDEYRSLTMSDDIDGLVQLADIVAIFLQIFYSMNEGRIIKNINLMNFIIKDNRCYGIDFENIGEGMIYEDIAGIIANTAVATIGDTVDCLPFARQLLKNFHLQLFDIINEIRACLEMLSAKGKMIDIDDILNKLLLIDDNSGLLGI